MLVANNVLWFEADPERSVKYGLLNLVAWAANILINYAMMDALVFGRLPNFPLPLDRLADPRAVVAAAPCTRGCSPMCHQPFLPPPLASAAWLCAAARDPNPNPNPSPNPNPNPNYRQCRLALRRAARATQPEGIGQRMRRQQLRARVVQAAAGGAVQLGQPV